MLLLFLLLLILTAVGHAALWIGVSNRANAENLPRWLLKPLGTTCEMLAAAGLLAAVALGAMHVGQSARSDSLWDGRVTAVLLGSLPPPLAAYAALCCVITLGPVAAALARRAAYRPPDVLRANHTQTLDLAADGARRAAPRGWLRLPGNQSLQLDVNDKHLLLPRLPAALHGLTIAHLSDLHFTGRVPRVYFDEVVARTNAWQADLVVITGDFADRNACLEWIVPVLGPLRSRYGVFFVLGNHDRRVDTRRLLRLLDEAGLVHVGGECREVLVAPRRPTIAGWPDLAPPPMRRAPLTARGTAHDGPRLVGERPADEPPQHVPPARLLVAGNERPWFGPLPRVAPPPAAGIDQRGAPPEVPHGPVPSLRLLLSHSPDQIGWAAAHDFDLLLCGHTHGGQICLPLVGPTVCPSRYGTRFASGVFHQPPTVMHVSRGLSGKLPLRINCRPELTRLILCSPEAVPDGELPPDAAQGV